MLYTYTGATFSAKDDTKRFWKFILISSILLVSSWLYELVNFRFTVRIIIIQTSIAMCGIIIALFQAISDSREHDAYIDSMSILLIIEVGGLISLLGYYRENVGLIICYIIALILSLLTGLEILWPPVRDIL